MLSNRPINDCFFVPSFFRYFLSGSGLERTINSILRNANGFFVSCFTDSFSYIRRTVFFSKHLKVRPFLFKFYYRPCNVKVCEKLSFDLISSQDTDKSILILSKLDKLYSTIEASTIFTITSSERSKMITLGGDHYNAYRHYLNNFNYTF